MRLCPSPQAFVRDMNPEGASFPQTLGELSEQLKAWRGKLQVGLTHASWAWALTRGATHTSFPFQQPVSTTPQARNHDLTLLKVASE